ncbi:uncharacterized [Tachysurus ichikawai]
MGLPMSITGGSIMGSTERGPQLAWAALRQDQAREQGPVPFPTLHLTGPFITQTPVTMTDGSGLGLAPHQPQNHTAHKPTDSWSAVSSGG